MAIRTQTRDYTLDRPSGYLMAEDAHGTKTGVVYTAHGIVEVDVTRYRNRPGEQFINFATVLDGRLYRHQQVRTGRDHVTGRGARIIATRWIRDLATRPTPGGEHADQ